MRGQIQSERVLVQLVRHTVLSELLENSYNTISCLPITGRYMWLKSGASQEWTWAVSKDSHNQSLSSKAEKPPMLFALASQLFLFLQDPTKQGWSHSVSAHPRQHIWPALQPVCTSFHSLIETQESGSAENSEWFQLEYQRGGGTEKHH